MIVRLKAKSFSMATIAAITTNADATDVNDRDTDNLCSAYTPFTNNAAATIVDGKTNTHGYA